MYTPSAPAAAHGAGPKATPIFHEGKLFTLGISGIVCAFDAGTGKILWRTAEPVEHPFFSAASSPAGDKGIVIVHPGNYGPLTAFDAGTGAVKWSAGAGGFFASPIIVTLGGVRQAVSVTQKGVIGVSVPDGRLLWEHPWSGGGAGGTMPVLYGDTIIVGASNMSAAAFKPMQRGEKWVTQTIWETKDVSMYLSNPVVIGDTLFGLSSRSSGQFFALDARSGAVLWLGPPREAANTAVAKAGELLFLLNDDAELIVARASRTGLVPLKRTPSLTAQPGPTRYFGQPDLHQGHVHARALDAGLRSRLTPHAHPALRTSRRVHRSPAYMHRTPDPAPSRQVHRTRPTCRTPHPRTPHPHALSIRLEPIADVANRVDVGGLVRVRLDLRAQRGDASVDAAVGYKGEIAPDSVQDRVARAHAPGGRRSASARQSSAAAHSRLPGSRRHRDPNHNQANTN